MSNILEDSVSQAANVFAYEDHKIGDVTEFGYKVERVFGSTGTGVTGYALRNANGEIIIAFRGTNDSVDVKDDVVNLGYRQWDQIRGDVTGYLSDTSVTDSVTFSGHSLGGALAEYAAYDLVKSGLIDANDTHIRTYNGLGAVLGIDKYAGGYDNNILIGSDGKNYFNPEDKVSQLSPHVNGTTMQIQDLYLGYDGLISAHGASQFDHDTLNNAIQGNINYLNSPELISNPAALVDLLQAVLLLSSRPSFLANSEEVKQAVTIIQNFPYGEVPELAQWLGETVSSLSIDVLRSIGNWEIEKANQILNGLKDISNAVTQKISSVGNAVEVFIDDTVNSLHQFAEEISNKSQEIYDATISTVADVLGSAVSQITNAYYGAKEFLDGFINNVGDWFGDTASDFQNAISAALRRLMDPIIVDMDGNGIELTSRADSNVVFDMDADGIKEWTGWIGKDDAFLCIDENFNGKIDSIVELIGDQNRSGFSELKTYDTNGDNVLNANDAIWAKLRLWRDANGNGVTDDGELLSLTQGNMSSIDLQFTTVNFTAEGNKIHETAVFEKISGGVGTLVDAWLDVDNVAQHLDTLTTGNTTIDALPNIRNYGDITNLRAAMLSDAALTTLVNTVINLQPNQFTGIRGIIEQIIYRWSDTQNIAVDSRGDNFDGRTLAAMEKFLGTEYSAGGATNPNSQAVPNLTRAWNAIVDGIGSRLILAGTLKSLLPTLVYDDGSDRFITLGTIDDVIVGIKSGQPSDNLARANYWSAIIPAINRLAEDSGIDINSSFHRNKIVDALNDIGLGQFQDYLHSGITNAILPTDKIFSSNGVYKLTSEADIVYLAGSSQAIFGMEGNDKLIVTVPYSSIMLDGGSGNDVLQGTESSDWLDGGIGDDIMIGLNGDDTYIVDSAGDVVTENRNEGTDTVKSSVGYVLGDNLENLVLLGTAALSGTGNGLNNSLSGNSGANTLDGGDGADTLDGGAGADKFIFNSTNGVDTILDFVSKTDKLNFSNSVLQIGDRDNVLEKATTISNPGGFSVNSELVIVTSNIIGNINEYSASAAIGAANTSYTLGAHVLFSVDNGSETGVFYFSSSNTNADVEFNELTLLGMLNTTPSTVAIDYALIA
ncbi:MAG: DUF2974 domain-containing protein [Methylovulum sp.]|nr:DUF2974 domain-containing protein [Methylovulum sp.]